MKERYHITGMTCSACSAHVEKAVRKLTGVKKVSVNLLTEMMEIEYDEKLMKPEIIIQAVTDAGYGVTALQPSGGKKAKESIKEQTQEKNRAMKLRLGVSIGFLLPLMYVAMFHMYAQWFGLPIPAFMQRYFHGNENAMTFALVQFLLLLPIVYVNRKFFLVGFKTLRKGSPNMDSLIAIGASAAIGYGIFAMLRIGYGLGHGDMAVVERYAKDLYFESAGMILTLITVGKYFEDKSKGKTSEAIAKLMNLSPKTCLILDETGKERQIPTEELRVGDIFLVKPGANIPADGTVLEGNSSVDESAVTGESIPVEKREQDRVITATINKNGFLKCRANRVGEDTTLAQIVHLVEEASSGKAPIAQMADKVAGVFVPIVMTISLITLIGWLIAGAAFETAMTCAIAVLVISCPCALGLATPVAIMVGTGVGAGNGILIKSGEALQQAGKVNTVVLDKTGTITAGKLVVSAVFCYGMTSGGSVITTEELLALAAAVEKQSEHPLGEAVVHAADRQKLQLPDMKDFKAVFGRGVEGCLVNDWGGIDAANDGPTSYLGEPTAVETKVQQGKYEAASRCLVGNLSFLEENGVVPTKLQMTALTEIAEEGMTPLLVALNGQYMGCIGVNDSVKASSVEAIQRLQKMNIHVVMLTGDNKRTAEAVQRSLGITEVVAEVMPGDKEQKIRSLQSAGKIVAMVGDGINDAPALAAADVGMAIGAGTDVALESADIVLMKSDLRDAVTAILLSRAVIRNIKQNLFWAFFYNAIGIPLAAGIVFGQKLNPMFAAAAMSLSSLFVVSNALRLRGFRSGFRNKEQVTLVKRRENVKKVMTIEGMMCAHCTGRVQKALEEIEGVAQVEMSLENKTASVELTKEVSDEVLKAKVQEAGYEVKNIL